MTRWIALLVLGAVLLVVFALVGEGGAMSRVAGMDKDRIQVAVDDVGGMAASGAGLAPEPGDSGQAGPIVRPTVVDDLEGESPEIDLEPDMASEIEEPVAEHELLTADQIDENNFDPRIR